MTPPFRLVRPNSRDAANLAEELARLWPLLGRHIAFHRRLVDLTASVKAALLLSQSIYWTRRGRDIAKSGGWFFKTSEQWERETGLTAREQASARNTLRGLGILDERRLGIPARLHFRLALDRLAVALGVSADQGAVLIDWEDAAAVARLLGPTVAYHRSLATVGGGVHAGLLLSRALQLTRLESTRRPHGWIRRSVADWRDELGLTRHEQEAARGVLARSGLWEETFAGLPARRWVRVSLSELLVRLGEQATAEAAPTSTGSSGSSSSDGGKAAINVARTREFSLQDSHIHVSTKAATKFRQNRPASFDKTGGAYIGSTQQGLLQPQHPPPGSLEPRRPEGGGELILPERLFPEERPAALELVARYPEQAQALLDELAGRMEAGAVKTSAIAYLRGMVRRAQAGTFIPELGPRIAAARHAREEAARQREREALEARRRAEARADPDYPTRMARRIEALRRAMAGSGPTLPATRTE